MTFHPSQALKRRDFDAQHLATLLWALATGSSGTSGSAGSALALRLALQVAKLPEKLLLRSTKAQLRLTAEAVNMNMTDI